MGDVQLERAGASEPEAGRAAGGTRNAAVGAGGAGALPVSRVWVAEVGREVIRQLAPEELVVFDAMADRWRSGKRPGRRPGAAVGFGIDAVLLSQFVFPIITGAVGDVLGSAAVERISSRRRRSERSRSEPQVTPPEASAGTAGGRPRADVKLTGKQTRDLHDACRRHAMTLGLSPDMAVLLADAVVGALH